MSGTKRAGIYVRISDDRDDVGAGVRRQEEDGRALAARRGEAVAKVYAENDTSAFKRRRVQLPDGTLGMRVVRPEFRAALADLQDGAIDTLIGYDLDRVVRDPRDLEDLIDICEETGRPAVSVTGSLQLENNAGITMARVAVAMANQSSRDTARRVARARQDAAASGRWSGGGRRAYGYTADRSAVIPEEAAVLVDIAAEVLGGASLTSIARRLNTTGVPTVSGVAWSAGSVRHAITKPAIAGKLVYRGEVMPQPAPWPAILEEDVWAQVTAELSARTPRATNQLRYWLSGILICALCGEPLRGNNGRYWCGVSSNGRVKGCGKISITGPRTEAAVQELLFRRVANIKVPVSAPRSIAPDESQLVELAQMWASKEISLAEYRAARATIESRNTPPTPARLPSWVGPNIRDEWEDKTVIAKRRVAMALLEGIVVNPANGHVWSVDRLEPHWRQT